MQNKIIRLIILINKLSDKLKSATQDLDKISLLLQDPEILSLLGESKREVLTSEDYD